METGGKGFALFSLRMLSWYPTELGVPAEENWKAKGEIEAHREREEELSSRERERSEDIICVLDLVIPGARYDQIQDANDIFLFIFLPGGESVMSTVLLGLV